MTDGHGRRGEPRAERVEAPHLRARAHHAAEAHVLRELRASRFHASHRERRVAEVDLLPSEEVRLHEPQTAGEGAVRGIQIGQPERASAARTRARRGELSETCRREAVRSVRRKSQAGLVPTRTRAGRDASNMSSAPRSVSRTTTRKPGM